MTDLLPLTIMVEPPVPPLSDSFTAVPPPPAIVVSTITLGNYSNTADSSIVRVEQPPSTVDNLTLMMHLTKAYDLLEQDTIGAIDISKGDVINKWVW